MPTSRNILSYSRVYNMSSTNVQIYFRLYAYDILSRDGVNQGCASAREYFPSEIFQRIRHTFGSVSLNRIVFGKGFETLWILEVSRECSISRLIRILSEYNFLLNF